MVRDKRRDSLVAIILLRLSECTITGSSARRNYWIDPSASSVILQPVRRRRHIFCVAHSFAEECWKSICTSPGCSCWCLSLHCDEAEDNSQFSCPYVVVDHDICPWH